jgi:PhnB protein
MCQVGSVSATIRGLHSAAMANAPEGWHTVTPRIVAEDARGLVAFLKAVFDGGGGYGEDAPSTIRIGDSIVMISESGERRPMPAFLYVYVADVDATYARAIAAGARSLEAPARMPYGDRRCMVEDRWGNTWQIATPT